MDDRLTRRRFLKKALRNAGGAAVGLTILPLSACEINSYEPTGSGTEIPFLTPIAPPDPNDQFFEQYGANGTVTNWPGIPTLTRADWRLRIDGLVGTPLTLTYDDVMAEAGQAITVLHTMRCIKDESFVPGLIGTTVWTGIPLRVFLDRAGIDRTRTRRLRFYGVDGFTNNLSMDQVYNVPSGLVEPLLVYAMDQQPLTVPHGFPVRLLVPGLYGFKSVKWLDRIEATDNDAVFGSYQDVLGFTDDARIRVVNKATNPLRGEVIPAGPARVFGYALSGFAGIERVEVAIGAGGYQDARIVPLGEVLIANPAMRAAVQLLDTQTYTYPFRSVWALWELSWDATPGTHTLRVRATDQLGNTQPDSDPDPLDGENPVFAINVTVQ